MARFEKFDRAGLGVAARTLLIGAVVLAVFLAGFLGVLRLAGGPEEAGPGEDPAAPGEEAAVAPDAALPDTTDDTGATVVEGNPAQDPTR